MKYGIRHVANPLAFISICVFPPRLSEWTLDITEAQDFEIHSEAKHAANYISKHAFNVEVFEIK